MCFFVDNLSAEEEEEESLSSPLSRKSSTSFTVIFPDIFGKVTRGHDITRSQMQQTVSSEKN